MNYERHGLSKYPEYNAWLAMRQRCSNPKQSVYRWYGARGIKVCNEWESFKTFITDMGRRPKGYSLDRIDSNADYCKENCRWSTKLQQANNTRDNRKVTYKGKVYGIRSLSELCGVSQRLLAKRLFERGWSVEKSVQARSFIGRNQFSK